MSIDLIGQVRLFLTAQDLVDPSPTDQDIIDTVNRNYLLYFEKVERRVDEFTASECGFAGISGDTTANPLRWFDVVEAYLPSTAGATFGPDLPIIPLHDVIRQRQTLASGTPTMCAIQRVSADDPDAWRLYLAPTPSAPVNVGILARRWPILLVAPGDIPELTEAAAYTVAKLSAAELAPGIGEPQLVATILQGIPDEVLELLNMPRPGFQAAPPAKVAA